MPNGAIAPDTLWYKDAIIYELHVKTFHDSDGDGVGDFRGLIEKLDYLQELGATAIWLLPFYPSPLRDDGYDIADYFDVNPTYGTLADFKAFLAAAHDRGLRVITELVINHTSDQNPWFQASRRAVAERHPTSGGVGSGGPNRRSSVGKEKAEESDYADFYVWSDSPEKYKEARIIFKDFETSNWSWDPVAKAYYWHRFYSHQPDLNFDNPAVHQAVEKVLDFWLEMGVDGLRLDAIPYLFEREGSNCENLPETHLYLKKLRAHMNEKFPGRMLLAEANQWPEDAVRYFGNGDESHMNFHFPLMPRMFMALQMEDRFPIIDILEQTPAIPDSCQWAMFLRNHDELTLEMVTDEERDYMWRVYATDPTARINLGIRRRLAPLLANNRRKIELLNVLLFSMPGTPVLYYGDEIGMGDNFYLGDRNGCRTPMQWSSDRNAGFSKANPQQLYLPITIDPEYHYEAINVENQQKNLSSLLWWTRRVIAMRKNFRAFSRGSLEFLHPENPKVLAFLRRFEDETILVVVNLSRYSQPVEIDLARFTGSIPMEVFSRNLFPPIRKAPYALTMAPHGHFWFVFQSQKERRSTRKRTVPTIEVEPSLAGLLANHHRIRLEREILPAYLRTCRWFGAKARNIREMRIIEQIPVADDAGQLWLLQVDYTDGAPDIYSLAVQLEAGPTAEALGRANPEAIIARTEQHGLLYDAIWDPEFRERIFRLMSSGALLQGRRGQLVGVSSNLLAEESKEPVLPSQVLKAEQSNSSMLFENRFFLKLYRKLENGMNPDVEVTRFLTERRQFPHVPAFVGSIEYRRPRCETTVVALLQAAVPNEGDAWALTLDAVGRYFERVLAQKSGLQSAAAAPGPLLDELIGGVYPQKAKLIGQRTGEMHLVLASDPGNRDFAPEPFNAMAQRSVYQSMRASLRRGFTLLRKKLPQMPEVFRDEANQVLEAEQQILLAEHATLERHASASKIRIHGDFHLGQVLSTGKDFVILDFEGEPARPLSERKLKRSALRDVAGMMRSFQYAAYSALWQPSMRSEDVPFLTAWADYWYRQMSSVFLESYLTTAAGASFLPAKQSDLDPLLTAYLLDKAVYEVGYELNHRPDWVIIPVRGIKHILNLV
jgi:maltose alpha-D-glucosyltransferase/alpha-amylase